MSHLPPLFSTIPSITRPYYSFSRTRASSDSEELEEPVPEPGDYGSYGRVTLRLAGDPFQGTLEILEAGLKYELEIKKKTNTQGSPSVGNTSAAPSSSGTSTTHPTKYL